MQVHLQTKQRDSARNRAGSVYDLQLHVDGHELKDIRDFEIDGAVDSLIMLRTSIIVSAPLDMTFAVDRVSIGVYPMPGYELVVDEPAPGTLRYRVQPEAPHSTGHHDA